MSEFDYDLDEDWHPDGKLSLLNFGILDKSDSEENDHCVPFQAYSKTIDHHLLCTPVKANKLLSALTITPKGVKKPQGNYPDIDQELLTPEMRSPYNQQAFMFTSRKDRTPRTVRKLMERHRESERVRHHTLNESMKAVCKCVPGFSIYARETKVVMMQRVISYIWYLENTIEAMCDEIGLTLDLSDNFLSKKLRTRRGDNHLLDDWRICCSPVRNIEPLTPFTKPALKRRRLKISSPTVDSTSDHPLLGVVSKVTSTQSSQDSMYPTSSHIPYFPTSTVWNHDTISGDVDSVLSHSLCAVSSTLLDEEPQRDLSALPEYIPQNLDVLCTPAVKKSSIIGDSRNCGQKRLSDVCKHYGIHISSDDDDMWFVQPSHSDVFYGDLEICLDSKAVLPTTKRSPVHPVHRRKQRMPMRSPLISTSGRATVRRQKQPSTSILSPLTSKTFKPKVKRKPLRGKLIQRMENDFVSYMPYLWKFHNTPTRRQKANAERLEAQRLGLLDTRTTICEEPERKPAKIDHRKTSWMNGFMMYSRLNRRQFITANPGVHTSHISKMMGHAWRNMPDEEQGPYKEKAKKYAQYMQKAIVLPPDTQVPEIRTETDHSVVSNDQSGSDPMETSQ